MGPSHHVSHTPVQNVKYSTRTLDFHTPADTYNHHPMTVSYRPHQETEVSAPPIRSSYVRPAQHVSHRPVENVVRSTRQSVRYTPVETHHHEPVRTVLAPAPTRSYVTHTQPIHPTPVQHHPTPVQHHPEPVTPKRINTESDHEEPVEIKKKNMRHNVPAPDLNKPAPGCFEKTC